MLDVNFASKFPEAVIPLTQKLRQAIAQHRRTALSDPGARHAAVAVVLSSDDDAAMLFVQRIERPGDPWSGHIAFPGGFMGDDDADATGTAIRETLEETGLDLARASVLGVLDDVYPRSRHLPKVIVTPCVFAVENRPAISAGPEVRHAFWITVEELFDPVNRRHFSLELPDEKREFSSIVVGGCTIWGLTERVLDQVGSLLAR